MKNIKINIDRKKISTEEIVASKNFKAVLEKATVNAPSNSPVYKNKWFIMGAGIIASGVILLSVLFTNSPNDNEKTIITNDYVKAPIPDADIQINKYIINSDSTRNITHTTGTEITVPAHSFVDDKGTVIQGEVEIQFREFHNKAEIFLSGIPMEYDSAGTQYNLESAGMIEIKGFQAGKEIFIAPGKSIDINMKSSVDGNEYNLYKLDTTKCNWVYKGKDKITRREQEKNIMPETVTSKEAPFPYPETEVFEEMPLPAKPVIPIEANSANWQFNIDVDYKDFPELQSYANTLWEVDESKKKFNPKHADILWEDVNVKKNTDNTYIVSFTKGNTTIAYDVQPVYEGNDYEAAKIQYKEKYKAYQTALSKRKEEEKRQADELAQRRAEWRRQIAERDSLLTIRREQQLTQTINGGIAININRSFSITGFGFWNCDHPARIPNARNQYATLVDKNNKPIIFRTLSLVDSKMNTVFAIPIANNSEGKYRIKYSPNAKNTIWGISSDNTLYVISKNDFKKLFTDLPYGGTVPMTEIKKEITCPKDFLELYENDFQITQTDNSDV